MNVLSKVYVIATVIALALAPFSVTSVFAAGTQKRSYTQDLGQSLTSKWKHEVATLERYKYLDDQVAKRKNNWLRSPRTPHRIAKANRYANEVHQALLQAEMLVVRHPGFDEKGTVIDKIQAARSVQSLAVYLHTMHMQFRHKLRFFLG